MCVVLGVYVLVCMCSHCHIGMLLVTAKYQDILIRRPLGGRPCATDQMAEQLPLNCRKILTVVLMALAIFVELFLLAVCGKVVSLDLVIGHSTARVASSC